MIGEIIKLNAFYVNDDGLMNSYDVYLNENYIVSFCAIGSSGSHIETINGSYDVWETVDVIAKQLEHIRTREFINQRK